MKMKEKIGNEFMKKLVRNKSDKARLLFEIPWLIIGSAILTWVAMIGEVTLSPVFICCMYIGFSFALALFVIFIEITFRVFEEKRLKLRQLEKENEKNDAGAQ